MSIEVAILVSILLPTLACISNVLHGETRPNLRDGITFLAALGSFACVLTVLYKTSGEATETLTLFAVMPGLEVAFGVEPLGLLFALIASGLWCVTHLYAVGYMRGNNEKNQTRFYTMKMIGRK